MARAAVLIDGGYYDSARKAMGRPDVDLVALSEELARPSERLRTYYYDALPWVGTPPVPSDVDRRARKQSYFAALRLLDRFEVREGRLQRIEERGPGGSMQVSFHQKLVDVKLSVELVRLAWSGQIDRAVLLSGDSDFVPAVEAAKDAGVIVKLVYARNAHAWAHDELLAAADERVELDVAFLQRLARRTASP